MPVINDHGGDLIATLLEELIDRIAENGFPADLIPGLEGALPNIRINVPKAEPVIEVNVPEAKTPVVNVSPPQVTVSPKLTVTPEVRVDAKPPDVHVEAPNITVNPPKVTVEAPKVTIENSSAKSWVFKVARNKDGLIETITATPK